MSEHQIPGGAIKITLPEVQQPDAYSCGAAALMSVAAYYGVGPEKLEDFKAALGTTPEHGTYYRNMETYACSLGLDVSVHTDMTCDELKKLLDEHAPVILSIQAYADDPKVYDNPASNADGHYVVAIGYDGEGNFYFMDPSLPARRGFLPGSELDQRWHENEGSSEPEIYQHLAIVVKPGQHKPAYDTHAVKIA